MEDEERAALRESLGFSDLGPGDTFSELARRSQIHEPANGDGAAVPSLRSVPAPVSVDRIEREVTQLAAAVMALTEQVATSSPAADTRQLDEVVRTQAAIVEQLAELRREICQVTRAGFAELGARLDVLETGGDRRLRLDSLRRQAGED
ncbi:MAG: hypothetical protein M3Z46_05745 [Actinomycetota bacterium]|nr:hypothetical protein [Actinomycetota bacterium]